MIEVAASDIDEKLDALLDKIAQGEEVVVTKSGKPVARLVPAPKIESATAPVYGPLATELIMRMRDLRKGQTLAPYTIRELREEGRR